MTNHGTNTSPEVLKAFRTYEARDRINNTKVGCFLVMTLMPLGIPMDFYVYPQHFNLFFNLRLCSAAIRRWDLGHSLYQDRKTMRPTAGRRYPPRAGLLHRQFLLYHVPRNGEPHRNTLALPHGAPPVDQRTSAASAGSVALVNLSKQMGLVDPITGQPGVNPANVTTDGKFDRAKHDAIDATRQQLRRQRYHAIFNAVE